MKDIKQQIIDIICQPQLAGFATITADGKPWVRYVFCSGREDMTIRFSSFMKARKVSQVRENPEVHMTMGVTDPANMKPYLQVQGLAECVTDRDERHRFWNDTLKSYFQGPDDPNYGIIIVKPYRIELWSIGTMIPGIWEAP